MKQPADAEAVYIQLGALLAVTPNLSAVDDRHQIPDETLRWLGDVSATVARLGSISDKAELDAAISMLISTGGRAQYAQKIKLVLYRCLTLAQQRAPATAQGTFVATGADFDAFAALHRIFEEAKKSILLVDPYMDESALLTFAILAKEGVSIGLLSDESGMRPALEPAAKAWISQYGDKRHLKVRKAPRRSLHDRLILVDEDKAWILTQSLKDFAARSPATIQRTDPQLALMKFEAYTQIWNSSTVVAETI
ncbi:phosphatidylserine/phosphatidylglycerophosphate/cardiolipin synthase family protein [Sphingobium fuliginis]|uniref:Phosphatidylserine/phosphatidylglycerophosphate/ cardiolipin synthase family protein n=1 Tax=Sphingobium fuliginis ATCC 27551 TaxID=1208342 RepID=A0A5B8CAG8_SPHSA|nr:phosphatidylserine/phosphatidylglycerophosphate/cardiolipin synthase family protein [Sphingobium fuliginis]QDC36464.1 phosphatidylserine/phosphatidylglycerophosphate/cardiolipin synthase family protein [Sphingobium fuliginis ATCC 27551]